MSKQKTDTRRYARFEMFEYAMIYFEGHSDPVRTVVVDIGLGGLQVRSRESLPMGTPCSINLGSAAGRTFDLRGEVRHSTLVENSDIYASGIRFLPTTHEDRVAVAEYVHAVFQRQGELNTPDGPLNL